jgi:hypothetical protein
MKMIISIILSMTLVLFITAVLSYFFLMHDNRQTLEVYIDRAGVIYVNGVVSTEARAMALINAPGYIATITYHPDSRVHYCFGQCL